MASRPIRVTIVRFAWRIAAGRAFALQQNERGRGIVSAGGRALRISDGPRRLSVPPFAAYRPQARPPTHAGVSACDALALSGHGSCGSPFLCMQSQLAESGGVPAVNPFAGRSGGSAGLFRSLPSLLLRGGNLTLTHTGTPAKTYRPPAFRKGSRSPQFSQRQQAVALENRFPRARMAAASADASCRP